MSLFGPNIPKRITKEEWKEIIQRIYGELDEKERNELEKFFRADLYEPGTEYGITEVEFTSGMEWLRSNMDKHEFESTDLDLLEKSFAEHLKD
jgi:hypothetical protein